MIQPRDNKLGRIYQGQVTLWFKDTAIQGSEPFVHAIELINDHIRKKNCNFVLQIN